MQGLQGLPPGLPPFCHPENPPKTGIAPRTSRVTRFTARITPGLRQDYAIFRLKVKEVTTTIPQGTKKKAIPAIQRVGC